ncbi:glycosyltransferase family 2 protein [Acidiplasma cupricumulans]|nr:glycosyltransferase family 2 protein [Acidiplasma cupricumulans]
MAENADAVTMNWIGYGNVESTTVNSLIISTYYTNTSIITGRDHAGMPVMPVGCGTLFKRDALNAVDSWDPEMIQDDLEIGTRLIHAGKK